MEEGQSNYFPSKSNRVNNALCERNTNLNQLIPEELLEVIR